MKPGSGRKRRSNVWNFFHKNANLKDVTCKICKKKMRYPGNTTNLNYHLVRAHPTQFKNGTCAKIIENIDDVTLESLPGSRSTRQQTSSSTSMVDAAARKSIQNRVARGLDDMSLEEEPFHADQNALPHSDDDQFDIKLEQIALLDTFLDLDNTHFDPNAVPNVESAPKTATLKNIHTRLRRSPSVIEIFTDEVYTSKSYRNKSPVPTEGDIKNRQTSCSILEKSVIKLQEIISLRKEVEDDEFDLFGKSIVLQLKRMPLDRALICQENLQKVINQERLHQMK